MMDFSWAQVFSMTALVVLQALLNPFFLLVIILVWGQYRRMLKMKESLFGLQGSALRASGLAVIYGIIGGFLGSFLMIIFGVTINEVGFGWLWVIALVLMLFSPHFLCFSYAGGVLALISLLTGYPQVNIPGLMGLVAVLHLVESLLILLSGHLDPLPVYVRNLAGRVVGAFNLQKFWPIPLAVMTILPGVAEQLYGELIQMPEWWPLIRPWGMMSSSDITYGLLPVIAALGYGELAITCFPRERTKRSACHLAVFSLILLGLAVLASHLPRLSILPALFSPLGHELLIFLGRREELQGRPRFVAPSRGVMVLDVVKGSPADKAGICSGDVILTIDGYQVNSRWDLAQMLEFKDEDLSMELSSGSVTRRARLRWEPGVSLGVIAVPEPGDPPNVNYLMGSPIKGLLRRLTRWFRSR